MALITGIMAGVGALSSGLQALQGAKQKRRAERALENYRRQELTNKAKDLTVSTRGADMQQEQQARLQAGQIDALRGAGTRGLLGGLGRVEEGSQRVSQQIGANLDEQQKAIDRQIMQEEINLRNMTEQRENADLSALSSQYNSGNQQMWSGIGGVAQSAISGLGAIKNRKEGGGGDDDDGKGLGNETVNSNQVLSRGASKGIRDSVSLADSLNKTIQSTFQPNINPMTGQPYGFGGVPTYNQGKRN